jgi:methionyl aminopeptidase
MLFWVSQTRFWIILEENMVFTIEPILTMFPATNLKEWADKWTFQLPLNPSAQWEHMVRVGSNGPEILTLV